MRNSNETNLREISSRKGELSNSSFFAIYPYPHQTLVALTCASFAPRRLSLYTCIHIYIQIRHWAFKLKSLRLNLSRSSTLFDAKSKKKKKKYIFTLSNGSSSHWNFFPDAKWILRLCLEFSSINIHVFWLRQCFEYRIYIYCVRWVIENIPQTR